MTRSKRDGSVRPGTGAKGAKMTVIMVCFVALLIGYAAYLTSLSVRRWFWETAEVLAALALGFDLDEDGHIAETPRRSRFTKAVVAAAAEQMATGKMPCHSDGSPVSLDEIAALAEACTPWYTKTKFCITESWLDLCNWCNSKLR